MTSRFDELLDKLTTDWRAPFRTNDRILKPALVIGIGEFGRKVLARFWEIGDSKYQRPSMGQCVSCILVHQEHFEDWDSVAGIADVEDEEPEEDDYLAMEEEESDDAASERAELFEPNLKVLQLDRNNMESGAVNPHDLYGDHFWKKPFEDFDCSPTRQVWNHCFLSMHRAWRNMIHESYAEITQRNSILRLKREGYDVLEQESDPLPVEITVVCSLNDLFAGSFLVDLVLTTLNEINNPRLSVNLVASIETSDLESESISACMSLYELAAFSCAINDDEDDNEKDEKGRRKKPWVEFADKQQNNQNRHSSRATAAKGLENYFRKLGDERIQASMYRNTPLDQIYLTSGYLDSKPDEWNNKTVELTGEFLFHLVYTDVAQTGTSSITGAMRELKFSSFGVGKVEVPVESILKFFVSRITADSLRLMVESRDKWFEYRKMLEDRFKTEDRLIPEDVEKSDDDGSQRYLIQDNTILPVQTERPEKEAVEIVEQQITNWLMPFLPELANRLEKRKRHAKNDQTGVPDPVTELHKLISDKVEMHSKKNLNVLASFSESISANIQSLAPWHLNKKKEQDAFQTYQRQLQNSMEKNPDPIVEKSDEPIELSLKKTLEEKLLKMIAEPSVKFARAKMWINGLKEQFGLQSVDELLELLQKEDNEESENEENGVRSPYDALENVIQRSEWSFMARETEGSKANLDSSQHALLRHVNRPNLGFHWLFLSFLAGFAGGFIFLAILGPLIQIPGAIISGLLLAFIIKKVRGAPQGADALANDYYNAYIRYQILKQLEEKLKGFRSAFIRSLTANLKQMDQFVNNAEEKLYGYSLNLDDCGYNALEELDVEHESFTFIQAYPAHEERIRPVDLLNPTRSLKEGTLQSEFFERVIPEGPTKELLQYYLRIYGVEKDLFQLLDELDPRPSAFYRKILASMSTTNQLEKSFEAWYWANQGLKLKSDSEVKGGEIRLTDQLIKAGHVNLKGTVLDLEVIRAINNAYRESDQEVLMDFVDSMLALAFPEINAGLTISNANRQIVLIIPENYVDYFREVSINDISEDNLVSDHFWSYVCLSLSKHEYSNESVKFVPGMSRHILMLLNFSHDLSIADLPEFHNLSGYLRPSSPFAGNEVFLQIDYRLKRGRIRIPFYGISYTLDDVGIKIEADENRCRWILKESAGYGYRLVKNAGISVSSEFEKTVDKVEGIFKYLTEQIPESIVSTFNKDNEKAGEYPSKDESGLISGEEFDQDKKDTEQDVETVNDNDNPGTLTSASIPSELNHVFLSLAGYAGLDVSYLYQWKKQEHKIQDSENPPVVVFLKEDDSPIPSPDESSLNTDVDSSEQIDENTDESGDEVIVVDIASLKIERFSRSDLMIHSENKKSFIFSNWVKNLRYIFDINENRNELMTS